MNRLNSTYSHATWSATLRGTFVDSSFTGKERDEETGYGYFGARYMDHELMMWLSVDPMADKYPSLSPYSYCAWNPVKLVDPDGMEMTASSDWYKAADGYVHWSANVHSQADLKEGETYIGRTVCMVAEGDDNVTYGDQYGQTHSSVPLPAVIISTGRHPEKIQQGPAWVDDASFGVALGTSMVGSAAGSAYPDFCPLNEAKIAKGFNATNKVMNFTGRLAGTAGLIYAGYNAFKDGHVSTGEIIRLGIQSASVITSFAPGCGTAISLGLTALDFFFGGSIEKIGSK